MEKKWKRNCPNCKKVIFYTKKFDRDLAETRTTNCILCIRGSEEYKQKMSEAKKGCVSWNKGKINVYSEGARKRMSESKMGDKNPAKRPEVRKRIRLTTLKNLEEKFGVKYPNHNPVGCEIINWYNTYYGFNFCHAENGGEVCVDGYFPDGLDEKRKTIIEIDEPRHFNPDGTYKQKDIRRQEYLESLGYTFIRVRI